MRALAAATLYQALKDAVKGPHQTEARSWLGSPQAEAWADALDLKPQRVRGAIQRMLEAENRPTVDRMERSGPWEYDLEPLPWVPVEPEPDEEQQPAVRSDADLRAAVDAVWRIFELEA